MTKRKRGQKVSDFIYNESILKLICEYRNIDRTSAMRIYRREFDEILVFGRWFPQPIDLAELAYGNIQVNQAELIYNPKKGNIYYCSGIFLEA